MQTNSTSSGLAVAALAAALVYYLPLPTVARTCCLLAALATPCVLALGRGWRDLSQSARTTVQAANTCRARTRLIYCICFGAGCACLSRNIQAVQSPPGALGLPVAELRVLEGTLGPKTGSGTAGLGYHAFLLKSAHGDGPLCASANLRLTLAVRNAPALPPGTTIRVHLAGARLPAENPQAQLPIYIDGSDITLVAPAPDWRRVLHETRQELLDAIVRVFGTEAAPLVAALLSGVRDGVDRQQMAQFREAGCAHILALSGQHLAVLTALLGVVLAWLPCKRLARSLSMLLIVSFVVVFGAGPSILRAALMFLFSSAGLLLDRPQANSDAWGFSFLAGLLIQPDQADSLSFILSHAAVCGIIGCAGVFGFLLCRWIPPWLSGQLALGLASLLATAPISVFVFGALYPAGLLVSLLAGPLLTLLLWHAVLALLFAPWLGLGLPWFGTFCRWTGLWLQRLLTGLMDFGAAFPALRVTSDTGRLLTAAGIVALQVLVYAVLHVRIRKPSRLQLAQRTCHPAREPGICHAEEIRPEFPDQSDGAHAPAGAAAG